MSEPRSARLISSYASSAASRPTSGSAPEPSPSRELAADVDLDRRVGDLELLDVRVDGDELDLREAGVDHAVDRVEAGSADADDADDREVRGRVGSRRTVERGAAPAAAQSGLTARSTGAGDIRSGAGGSGGAQAPRC